MFEMQAMDHVALLVRDLDRAVQWYQEVLGMERRYANVWTGKRDPVVMAKDDIQLALFLPLDPEHRWSHDRNEHFAVRVDRENFERARRELEDRGISLEMWDHTICLSFYFLDPDGNQIEVTTFDID